MFQLDLSNIEGEIVLVTWEDCEHLDECCRHQIDNPEKIVNFITYGMVIDDTKNHLVIASTHDEGEESDDTTYRDVTRIPKCLIRKIQRLAASPRAKISLEQQEKMKERQYQKYLRRHRDEASIES
jgi:hypothetical protein